MLDKEEGKMTEQWKALKKTIAELRDSDSTASQQVVCEFLFNYMEVLENMMWIPVSEWLPEADEYVENVAKYYLVQNEYGDMLVAHYTHSGYWEQIYQLQPIGDKIVAWMPLPEPYKTESEDEEQE